MTFIYLIVEKENKSFGITSEELLLEIQRFNN
jgi:hypothetical protein